MRGSQLVGKAAGAGRSALHVPKISRLVWLPYMLEPGRQCSMVMCIGACWPLQTLLSLPTVLLCLREGEFVLLVACVGRLLALHLAVECTVGAAVRLPRFLCRGRLWGSARLRRSMLCWLLPPLKLLR